LACDWKDNLLNPETVEMLQDNERNDRIRQWVNREDAPIRKFFADPHLIDELLQNQIKQEKYTLTFHRRQGEFVTVEDLRRQFGTDLSDLETHRGFWEVVQQQLMATRKGWFKPHIVKEGESLEEIATQNRLSVEEIKMLNSDDDSDVFIFEPNMKLKVKPDLTSESSLAQEQRRKIAIQFFPRLSWKQRDALFERQMRRDQYLQSYQNLKMIALSSHFLDDLESWLISEPDILSTSQKVEIQSRIDKIKQKPDITNDDFKTIKIDVEKAYQPTYFNLVKAMYPLLPNAYELNLQLYGQNKETAGLNIGLYSKPLEDIIDSSRRYRGQLTPSNQQFVKALEARLIQIKSNPDLTPGYFGELSSDKDV
jgi:hypothetical protein